MGFLEKQLYQRIQEKYGDATKTEFIKNFKRFLDDCFIFWQKSRAELEILFNMLNNINPKIQFTMEFSSKKLSFLDILICKENSEIHSYYNGTDSHQYLDFFSCHPKHVKQSNYTACISKKNMHHCNKRRHQKHSIGRTRNLSKQPKLPKKLINNGIEKAKKLTFEELRNPKKKSDNNNKTLPLVITHNPNNPQIVNMVRQSMNFLRHSKKMESTLKNIDLIVSRRQPKKLKTNFNESRICTARSRGK